jgi:uncharacterized protein YyaL (SSP411 family)
VEGRFFIWTVAEITDVLGDEAEEFASAYGVTERGNFEGRSILEFVGDLEQRPALSEARRRLFGARERRVHPGRDEKVITAWNGLTLAAFAEAARALDRQDYRQIAERNAGFLLCELRQNGRLLRTWKGGAAKLNGYLEDYACLIEGLLELYQTTFEPRWFLAARELAETLIVHFGASGARLAGTGQRPGKSTSRSGIAGFYDTSDDHEALVTRPRDLQDNATPSGNSMAVTGLLKLGALTHEPQYVDIAHRALARMQLMMRQYPLGFGQWLQALAYAVSEPREIAVVGGSEGADPRNLLNVVRSGYRPFQVVAAGLSGAQSPAVPLLENRGLVAGQAAAYVCRGSSCRGPLTDPGALLRLLEGK